MGNYEYIIASLPILDKDGKGLSGMSEDEIIDEISELCSDRDKALIGILRRCWGEDIDADFYQEALSRHSAFLKTYFRFDLTLRNVKAEFLNNALGRQSGLDVISLEGFEADEETRSLAESIFKDNDLLHREKSIDDAYWEMIDAATVTELFSIDAVLAFIAKLHIVERWLRLDDATGKEMFSRLIGDIRGTYGEVKFNS